MKRLDIYLGLAACLVGVAPPYMELSYRFPNTLGIKLWVLPSLWLCLVLVMIILRRRPLYKLWWVWPSGLGAFFMWLGLMLIFIAWSTHGFAP